MTVFSRKKFVKILFGDGIAVEDSSRISDRHVLESFLPNLHHRQASNESDSVTFAAWRLNDFLFERNYPSRPRDAYFAICRLMISGLLENRCEVFPFSYVQIGSKGMARLDELIHHDRTRLTHDVAKAALAEMGLP